MSYAIGSSRRKSVKENALVRLYGNRRSCQSSVVFRAVCSQLDTPLQEIALVRMGADSKQPPELRRNYKHVVDCCMRIVKEEGVAVS